jgi:hypothetical protein
MICVAPDGLMLSSNNRRALQSYKGYKGGYKEFEVKYYKVSRGRNCMPPSWHFVGMDAYQGWSELQF